MRCGSAASGDAHDVSSVPQSFAVESTEQRSEQILTAEDTKEDKGNPQ
jgi:hypothetical protein